MVFNQTISEFTECHVTAFHPMNIFKLNHYVIKMKTYSLMLNNNHPLIHK